MKSFHIIIPARYASTRFPGKPLALLKGKPMIQHVYEQCLKTSASSVIVATDDLRIADAVKTFSGKVCMTNDNHATGTDRIAEVITQNHFADNEIIVNVQSDESMIEPDAIEKVASLLMEKSESAMATCATRLLDQTSKTNPNIVKIVLDQNHHAIYFSRALIPYVRFDEQTAPCYKHIGLYAYRAGFIKEFFNFPQTPLELTEGLEQLRALENGKKIAVCVLEKHESLGVDTPEDLLEVEKRL